MAEENWKLLTVTRGGAVSLIKGLSEIKAKELSETLRYDYPHRNATGIRIVHYNDGDIVRTETFE